MNITDVSGSVPLWARGTPKVMGFRQWNIDFECMKGAAFHKEQLLVADYITVAPEDDALT